MRFLSFLKTSSRKKEHILTEELMINTSQLIIGDTGEGGKELGPGGGTILEGSIMIKYGPI